MSLPISKEQLNRLGERLVRGDGPAKEDLHCLNEVLRAYQAILVTVEEQLALIGLTATSRVKTRAVLIDKLKRERGMRLARVQDMAGARTVIDGGWADQDAVVGRLIDHFGRWTGKAPKCVDRRLKPSHGYRAVHVIVFPDGVPVEIQVRTELQNYWAQIVERLADHWGRGIRYGDDPEGRHRPAEGVRLPDGSPVTRKRVIDDLRYLADQIAGVEQVERGLQTVHRRPAATLEDRIVATLGREISNLDTDAARFYSRLRARFKRVVSAWSLLRSRLPKRSGRRNRPDRRRVGRIIRRTVPDVRPASADFVRASLLRCDTFVDGQQAELGARLKQQQAILREGLQSLEAYVEQGGIR